MSTPASAQAAAARDAARNPNGQFGYQHLDSISMDLSPSETPAARRVRLAGTPSDPSQELIAGQQEIVKTWQNTSDRQVVSVSPSMDGDAAFSAFRQRMLGRGADPDRELQRHELPDGSIRFQPPHVGWQTFPERYTISRVPEARAPWATAEGKCSDCDAQPEERHAASCAAFRDITGFDEERWEEFVSVADWYTERTDGEPIPLDVPHTLVSSVLERTEGLSPGEIVNRLDVQRAEWKRGKSITHASTARANLRALVIRQAYAKRSKEQDQATRNYASIGFGDQLAKVPLRAKLLEAAYFAEGQAAQRYEQSLTEMEMAGLPWSGQVD